MKILPAFFLACVTLITGCSSYEDDPGVKRKITLAELLLAEVDSLNATGKYGGLENSGATIIRLRADTECVEIATGLTGNHKPGFGYVLKSWPQLDNGFSVKHISDFEYSNAALESRGEKFSILIEELEQGDSLRVETMRVRLIKDDETELPFEVRFNL